MRIGRELKTDFRLGRALLGQITDLNQSMRNIPSIHGKALTSLAKANAAKAAGFGSFSGGDTWESLRSGDAIPDELFGWSTKTVLTGVILAILIKQKLKRQG